MTTDRSKATVRPSDPHTIIAGIRQFGLAPDGSDLRDLEAAVDRLEQASNAFDAMKEALEHALLALEVQPRTVTENGEPYLTPLWTPEQSEVRAAAKRKIRAALRLASGEELGPVICEECGIYPADLPSKICPGCEAYREHTGHI